MEDYRNKHKWAFLLLPERKDCSIVHQWAVRFSAVQESLLSTVAKQRVAAFIREVQTPF